MRRAVRVLSVSAVVLSLLGAACRSTPSPESSAESAQALGAGRLPPPPHPGAHSLPLQYPALDQVFQKNVHNAYWTNVHASPDDPFAAGPHMRIWDMMLHEHTRSLEWDLHDDIDDPFTGRGKHPGEFRVYHTNEPDNSTCFTLADCLQLVQRFDHVLPQHEVVHIALELKQVDKLLQDVGLFDDSDFRPEDIDRLLWEHLGSKIYTPAEFLSRCEDGATMRSCAAEHGWPSIDELRGRFIFTVHGTETGGSSGACNERSWWQYSGGDIKRRAAFPMYVVSDEVTDVARPRERALHYNTATAAFMSTWRTALDNTIVFDLENTQNRDFAPTDPATKPLNQQINAIVRPAAAHLIDVPVPNAFEDDVGKLRQRDVVDAGWQWLMTDYPVNFISDEQLDDPNPLKLPTRVSRPFFTRADVVPGRTGAAPQPPTWGEPELVEPGSRIYFDTSNRITQMDLFSLAGAQQESDPLHAGIAQALLTAPDPAIEPVQDWEIFPATSMLGHDQGPRETTPFGGGCFVASADPSAGLQRTTLRICREPTNDDARTVNISLWINEAGNDHPPLSETIPLPFHIVQGASIGDGIRVRLQRNLYGTVAQIFTTAEVNPDGSLLWVPWPTKPSFAINADLRYQGLYQARDGVFTGTRLNGQPVSLSQLTLGPNDHYVYDLSWCNDGSCRGAAPASHETFFTATSDNATYVGVHETEGAVYGNQWRTLYPTDRYEVSTSGLGQLPRPNKFLLRRSGGAADGWAPVYRCIDWTRDVHTYWLDTDPSCPNDKGPAGRSAGIVGSIATRALANTAPLIHMRKGTHNATNVNTHDHYFALGYAEAGVKASAEGYEQVKVLGWVYTPDSVNIPVCVPKTACSPNAQCGTEDDGCGTELSCGACAAGKVCSPLRKCIPTTTNAGCIALCNQRELDCFDSADPRQHKTCVSARTSCVAACKN